MPFMLRDFIDDVKLYNNMALINYTIFHQQNGKLNVFMKINQYIEITTDRVTR